MASSTGDPVAPRSRCVGHGAECGRCRNGNAGDGDLAGSGDEVVEPPLAGE